MHRYLGLASRRYGLNPQTLTSRMTDCFYARLDLGIEEKDTKWLPY